MLVLDYVYYVRVCIRYVSERPFKLFKMLRVWYG
jgi:hypothetical protein